MTKIKETVKKVCEYCGKEFIAGKTTTRCCSHLCNSRAYKDKLRKNKIEQSNQQTFVIKEEKKNNDLNGRMSYKVAEVAELLGVCKKTVYNMAHAGKIAAIRVSRRMTLIPKTSIEDFLSDTTAYEVLPNNEHKPVTEWYSLDEAATKYGIKYRRLRDIINKEHIPEKKDGRNTFIGKNQTDNYFK